MSPNGDCFFTSLALALELLGSDAPHDISQIPVRHRAQYLRNLAAAKMSEQLTTGEPIVLQTGKENVFNVTANDIERVGSPGVLTENVDVAVLACVLQVGIFNWRGCSCG